jgi:hypothetical protein
MKRIYLFCGVGCVVALLAVTALSQGFQGVPANPEADFSARTVPPPAEAPRARNSNSPPRKADPFVAAPDDASLQAKKQTGNVYELLEKLEALKAKKDALESEIRETRALLGEKFRTLQERVAKAGMPPHGPAIPTCQVPLTTATPHVCVPPQPPSPVVPAQDVGFPVTPPTATPVTTPEPRPVKATKTDRPIEPATETPTVAPVSPKDEPDMKPQPPKNPPTTSPK